MIPVCILVRDDNEDSKRVLFCHVDFYSLSILTIGSIQVQVTHGQRLATNSVFREAILCYDGRLSRKIPLEESRQVFGFGFKWYRTMQFGYSGALLCLCDPRSQVNNVPSRWCNIARDPGSLRYNSPAKVLFAE